MESELIELLIDGARYGDMDDVSSALSQGVPVDSRDEHGRTGETLSEDCNRQDNTAKLCKISLTETLSESPSA